MNREELRQFWPIPEPWTIVPIAQGVNNLTQVIETLLGSYVLRSYRKDRALEQIRYELGVLKSLQERSLPFQLPVPIPTATGELFAILAESVVSLSARLPGAPPPNDNLEQAYAAGKTLAELGKALSGLQIELIPGMAPFPPSADFEAWAGIPITPAELLQGLPLSKEEQDQILKFMELAQASAPTLYQTLPQQIIHRDYDQSNVLMDGNSVTGVLDFEFCGPDLRIIDLAYALSEWPSGWWNTGKEWSVMAAFGEGYCHQQQLTSAELEALPQIFRLRATTSLFFHLGRFAQGVETSGEVLEGIRERLTTESWLQLHAGELVEHAYGWQRGITA